jgi:hypothetical protein
MHCGCKFAKQEIAANTALLEISGESIVANPTRVALENEQATIASIGNMLKTNNLIMNQIEQMLTGFYCNPGVNMQQAQFKGFPINNVTNCFTQLSLVNRDLSTLNNQFLNSNSPMNRPIAIIAN